MGAIWFFRHGKWLAVCVVGIAPLFSGCQIARDIIFPPRTPTEYEQDIEFRGEGSQRAWLNATGGSYNGNLPRD